MRSTLIPTKKIEKSAKRVFLRRALSNYANYMKYSLNLSG